MGGNGVPPPKGPPAALQGANAAAAAGPKGPPGGAVLHCAWEVYVKTRSQHRFWPGENFNHELQSLNGGKLAGAQHAASVKMDSKVSPESKFGGAGAKTFGVTNTVPGIAKEDGWKLVSGPDSKTELAHQNVAIHVSDGRSGPRAQHIELHVRHPLLVYGQLRFKDPEDREVNFPKDFYVAAYSGKDAKADTKVAHAKLDVEGKFDFEVDRKWDWFTFKFGDGTKQFISNNDAKTEKTELKPWSDRKTLEKDGAKFFSPPNTWGLIESEWKFSEEPKYIDGSKSYKPDEAKIYVFDPPTKNWVRRIGEKGVPVQMVLDPKWQFMRHEFFDRYYGHTDHGHERVNMPSTLIGGYWGPPAKMERESSSHWTLLPADAKKSVHCLPWIRQKDLKGAKAEKPDKDALIQFELPASTFSVSTDATTRKYEHISANSDRLKASADRLKFYDMPAMWKSKGYWSRYAKGPKAYDAKFWENWDQPGLLKSRAQGTPMIFLLDDIVLTDSANVPLQKLTKTDQFAIFYHRFKKEYDEQANLSEEGVYMPDPVEPFYSKIDRQGAKFNYIADYPNWVRMVAGLSSCFDAFDQRTSKEVFGARAAVRWYDAAASATPAGSVLANQPKDIAKKYFVIGPEWGQQHAATNNPFIGSDTPSQRIGRCDMVLVRCCDRLDTKELFLNLQYFRLNYNFLGAAPAGTSAGSAGSVYSGTDGKAFTLPAVASLMQRWNGYDGASNPSRTELIPQKAGVDHQGEVLYFVQSASALKGAHFRMDVFQSGDGSDRAFMSSDGGVGQVTDTGSGVDNSFAANSFTAGHELGHGGSLPDEYGEWWERCNHNGPGILNNIPADPFCDEGRDIDLAATLYGGGAAPYPIMTMAVEMRNRYFWHNAEFARKHIKIPLYSKHGAYHEYKVPGHPKFPYRTYAYWPVRKKMNRRSGKHGATDIYLHVLGKETFTQALMPNGPWDGMVSILIKIDLTVPATVSVTDVRDAIRNAILIFNQQFSATGSTRVKTDDSPVLKEEVKFTKAVVRFSPRFLISNVNPTQTSFSFGGGYAKDYAGWQGWVKTHFQVNVVDNAGAKAPVPSAFNAKKGGAMTFGIDSTKAWKPTLAADVQALLPDMLGIQLSGAVIAAKDLTPLVGDVIHSNAKVS